MMPLFSRIVLEMVGGGGVVGGAKACGYFVRR